MNFIPAVLTRVNSARRPGKEGMIVRVRASCCRALVHWEDGKETLNIDFYSSPRSQAWRRRAEVPMSILEA